MSIPTVRYSKTLLMTVSVALCIGLLGSVDAQSQTLTSSVNAQLDLQASTIQALSFDYDAPTGELFTTFEPRPGTTWTLQLVRFSMRADDFQVLVDVNGTLRSILAPAIVTWRGEVLEEPGSRVYASYINGKLEATVYAAGASYGIEPVPGSNAGDNRHVVYDSADASFPDDLCGTPDRSGSTPPSGPIPAGTGLDIIEVAVDCDFAYYQDLGSSVVNCVNAVENRMNQVAGTYDNAPINKTMEVTTIVVRATSGTYVQSDDSAALNEFRSNWQNAPESSIRRDIAHLFTGRNLIGSLGIAYTFSACGGSAYGSSEESCNCSSNTKTGLVAHEIGHNFGALHCDGASGGCRIMCSGSGGCNGFNPLTFAAQASNQIVNFANGLNCLSPLLSPRSAPFEDNFTSASLSNANWSYIDGAVSSTSGVNEPSGAFSMNLDSPGNNEFQYDEVRSNFILLSGADDPVLEYRTQHRGVENGESLIVDYLNSSLDWVNINTVVSDGSDQTTFIPHSHDLPFNARHNQFRVRFRTVGNSTTDDWFIDDVYVGEPTTLPTPVLVSVSPNNGSVTGGTVVSLIGVDFEPSASVTWDGQSIASTYLGPNEIEVVTPASGSGTVSVQVSQGIESSTLNNAFTYVSATLRLENVEAVPGSTVSVRALGTHSVPLEGYSFGVDHDGVVINVLSVSDIGTDAEGASFFAPVLNNDSGNDGGWMTLGVIFDLQGPGNIPSGVDNALATIEYEVLAVVPAAQTLPLSIVETLNNPPVTTDFAAPGATNIVPETVDGSITTIAGALFLRGDVDNNGSFSGLTDSLFLLNFGFLGGPPPPCEKAADADDDGSINTLVDTLYILNHQFNGAVAPPAPYPVAGVDPTPDSLTCTP